MAQVIVVDSRELLSGAPLPILLVLKHTNGVAYPLRGFNYLVLEIVPFDVRKEV